MPSDIENECDFVIAAVQGPNILLLNERSVYSQPSAIILLQMRSDGLQELCLQWKRPNTEQILIARIGHVIDDMKRHADNQKHHCSLLCYLKAENVSFHDSLEQGRFEIFWPSSDDRNCRGRKWRSFMYELSSSFPYFGNETDCLRHCCNCATPLPPLNNMCNGFFVMECSPQPKCIPHLNCAIEVDERDEKGIAHLGFTIGQMSGQREEYLLFVWLHILDRSMTYYQELNAFTLANALDRYIGFRDKQKTLVNTLMDPRIDYGAQTNDCFPKLRMYRIEMDRLSDINKEILYESTFNSRIYRVWSSVESGNSEDNIAQQRVAVLERQLQQNKHMYQSLADLHLRIDDLMYQNDLKTQAAVSLLDQNHDSQQNVHASETCVICLTSAPTITLHKLHKCMCIVCYMNQGMPSNCPLCRQPLSSETDVMYDYDIWMEETTVSSIT